LELREYLKQKLPEHMLPSTFVFLDSLPLTPNGKVDRDALPAPATKKHGQEKVFVAPRDSLELQFCNIWETILGVKPIGIRDNFFDIGGHSLLAVKLFAEIEKAIDRRLPLTAIFQAPTIEQLASILRQEEWAQSHLTLWSKCPSSVVPFQPNGSKPPLFWFSWGPWDFRLPRCLPSDQPVYGLQHQSQDGHRALYTSIEEMAAHYIREIRTVRAQGPYFLGGYCIGGMVVYEMAQQLQKRGEEVALLLLVDPTNPRFGKLSEVSRGTPSLLPRVARFRNKIYRHLRELAPLRSQEKLSYVLVRVRDRIMGLRENFSWVGRRFLCEAFEHPLPPSLRAHYIVSIYERAASAYVPELYRGRVVLFKTQGPLHSDRAGWENLIDGGLEVQELDTAHDDVFKEPYVQTLAAKIKTSLSDAHMSAAAPGNFPVISSVE
jgi:thioesterase domain-containing protein